MFTDRVIRVSFVLIILLFLLLEVAVHVSPVSANTITVTTTVDEDVDNSACSLREAIIAANTDATYNGCSAGSGADIITVPAGIYTLSSQLPDLDGIITINGVGSTFTIVEANACNPIEEVCTHINRIVDIAVSGTVTLADLTLRHGRSIGNMGVGYNYGNLTINDCIITTNEGGYGGAIRNHYDGILTINDSIISYNFAQDQGGGIWNLGTSIINNSVITNNIANEYNGGGIHNIGTLTISNSSISENYANDDGGGIYNSGTLTIINSTFFENESGDFGGGICNDTYSDLVGSLTINNSSISHNIANRGGGIYNMETLTINNSTFFENTAVRGGGIYNGLRSVAPPIELGWIIITNSTFSSNIASYDGGGFYNEGVAEIFSCTFSGNENEGRSGAGLYNDYWLRYFINTIIANSINGSDCVNLDTIGTNISNLVEDGSCGAAYSGDPSLGALADNGGDTLTHALLPGSIAIDAGNLAACPETDQRGVTRPKGGGCDIGAYEFYPAVADMTGTPTSGTAPLEVDFTNNSTGDFDICEWDFGDGVTSDECDPSPHTYAELGVYTVSLTVSGSGVSYTRTREDYIHVAYGSFLPAMMK